MDKLEKENRILREKNWASSLDQRHSNYFILIDTKIKPTSEYEEEELRRKMDEFMKIFKLNIPHIVTFNNTKKRKHHWSAQYIDDVFIRYVIEKGNGGLKKDGTVGNVGGTLHLHIVLKIAHHSNISINQEPIFEIANKYFLMETGRRPFVAKPRLISIDLTEQYMTKSKEFESGIQWDVIQ
jgi:hypothetical protein